MVGSVAEVSREPRTGGERGEGVVWGLGPALLAWTHRRNKCCSYLGHGRVMRLTSHAAKPLPHLSPTFFMQVKKRAVWKGKMLGGTTDGNPRSLGWGHVF